MILADTVAIFLVIVGLLISFNAVWLFAKALWPNVVSRATTVHEGGLVKSFFIGLPITVATVFVIGLLGSVNQGPAGMVAVVVLAVFFIFSSIGVAGLATLFGERLDSSSRFLSGEPGWKTTLRGGIVLVLSYLFPLAGWFVILPVTTVIGCGASVRAVWRGRNERRAMRREPAIAGEPAKAEMEEIVSVDRQMA